MLPITLIPSFLPRYSLHKKSSDEKVYTRRSLPHQTGSIVVHLFRRDLNIIDNYALYSLVKKYGYTTIKYIFIFNKQQIEKNKLFNDYQFKFLCSQLSFLATIINLTFYYVNTVEEEVNIIKKLKITTLSFNKDYTPYAKYRDSLLVDYCNNNNIELITSEYYYWTREYIKIYYKYSTYYAKYNKNSVKIHAMEGRLHKPSKLKAYSYKPINHREDAFAIMKNKFIDYGTNRDQFMYKTTEIGIYIKFCAVTSREVFNNYINNKELIRELIFRDFFYTLDYIHPEYFKDKVTHKDIKWNNNQDNINNFVNGTTGEHIIDAAISQLKTTNHMHNRARMLCVHYLVKHLGENWVHGELLFAKYLKDYDPIINFQNWVYMAGLHIYSFPFYRVFSYTRQIRLYGGNEYIEAYLDNKSTNKIKYDEKATYYMKQLKKNK